MELSTGSVEAPSRLGNTEKIAAINLYGKNPNHLISSIATATAIGLSFRSRQLNRSNPIN
jgi:hypothetical protein